jgi:hypothetical protein
LIKCPKFKDMSPQARKDVIVRSKRCFVCFKEHQVKDCTYKRTCNLCDGRHHPLLHVGSKGASANALVDEEEEEEPPPQSDEQ